jgi:hypothetical protein
MDDEFSPGRRVDVIASNYGGTDGWVVKFLPASVRVKLRFPSSYWKKNGILMRRTNVQMRQDRSHDMIFPSWTGRWSRCSYDWATCTTGLDVPIGPIKIDPPYLSFCTSFLCMVFFHP